MLNAGLLKPVKAEIERRPLVESDQEAERVLFQEDCNSDAARERRRTELRRFAQPVLRPGGARNRPKAPIYFSSEIADEAELKDIEIGDHVFVGSRSIILGGARIGHHSVVGAHAVVRDCEVPPFSLVVGTPAVIKPGYYRDAFEAKNGPIGD